MQDPLPYPLAPPLQLARAFNHVYDLKLTVRGEMEFAYLGEIATPSKCGEEDGDPTGMAAQRASVRAPPSRTQLHLCEARARGGVERPLQVR